MYNFEKPTIESVKFDEQKQTIEVIYRIKGQVDTVITTIPPRYEKSQDKVWKEIYGIKDGKLALIRTVEGKVTPSKTIPESIDWLDNTEDGIVGRWSIINDTLVYTN